MSWNYRVVKMLLARGHKNYAVYEVFYGSDDLPEMVTSHDVSPDGKDRDDFLACLELWNVALENPVLIYDNKKHKFIGEEPPLVQSPPPCPDCGRPMTRREPWTCVNCGEECDL